MYLNPLSIAHIVIYRFAFSYGTLKNKFCTCNFYVNCQTFIIISTNICIFPFRISCWILSAKPLFKIQPSQYRDIRFLSKTSHFQKEITVTFFKMAVPSCFKTWKAIHSVHWGINSPSKTPPSSFPPIYWFFVNPPLPLSWSPLENLVGGSYPPKHKRGEGLHTMLCIAGNCI